MSMSMMQRVPGLGFTAAILFVCYLLCSCTGDGEGPERRVSVVRRGPWQHEVVEGVHPEAAITATFTNQINKNGWSFLEIHSGMVPPADEELAYMAGMVEANLTGHLIEMQWKNTMGSYCSTPSDYCTKLEAFLSNNSDFMTEQIRSVGGDYWHQVNLFNRQLAGLRDGYSALGLEELPKNAFLLFQVNGDLDALESALGGDTMSHVPGSGSCSALVKVLPGNAELFVSHDTWTEYNTMLRIYKLYDLKFRTSNASNAPIIPGYMQSFSSYPGRLLSGDDFYMISSGLVTMETTIGNNNADLWKNITPKSVMEGIRNVVANRLATSGSEWSAIFAEFNSGTYNNEWMVVDYKLFTKNEENLKDGLLWVLEQLPGIVVAEDQTEWLRNTSYWPSYNIPFYPVIFNMSGSQALVDKYGDWFTWSGAPRAKMFAQRHSSVTDLASIISLMRYNDFQHDPLAKCNCTPPYSGENGISARSDLNPANGTYPFSALGHRSHGGTDNKVTSSQLFFSEFSCLATSGPTHEQQPVFQWSTSGFHPTPLGHPDKWAFSPVWVRWNN